MECYPEGLNLKLQDKDPYSSHLDSDRPPNLDYRIHVSVFSGFSHNAFLRTRGCLVMVIVMIRDTGKWLKDSSSRTRGQNGGSSGICLVSFIAERVLTKV